MEIVVNVKFDTDMIIERWKDKCEWKTLTEAEDAIALYDKHKENINFQEPQFVKNMLEYIISDIEDSLIDALIASISEDGEPSGDWEEDDYYVRALANR